MGRAQKPKQCYYCKHKFSSPNKLKNHLDSKVCLLNKKVYECSFCKKKYLKKKWFENHKLRHSIKEKRLHCRTCQQSFLNRSMLYNHINTKHKNDKKSYSCRKCSQIFTDRRQLFKHHTKYHLLAGRQLQNVPKDIANFPWNFISSNQQQKINQLQKDQAVAPQQSSSSSTVTQHPDDARNLIAANQKQKSIHSKQEQAAPPQQSSSPQYVSSDPPDERSSPEQSQSSQSNIQFHDKDLKEAYDLHAPFILQKHQMGKPNTNISNSIFTFVH